MDIQDSHNAKLHYVNQLCITDLVFDNCKKTGEKSIKGKT